MLNSFAISSALTAIPFGGQKIRGADFISVTRPLRPRLSSRLLYTNRADCQNLFLTFFRRNCLTGSC